MILSPFKSALLMIFLAGSVVGCATTNKGVTIPETPLDMSRSRTIISTIIGKPRHISENGREMYSDFYDHRNLDYDPVKSGKERFFTHILILNDRRPYDIEVRVAVEEKQGPEYVLVGYDQDRAKKLADRIQKALHESRDKRNLIDDFKPY